MSKTSYVGVNNVARQCKSIYVGVNNIARKVTKAYVGDNNGKARLWWDESGIIASDLPVGQIVKLMEGGVETEFIVVNQGIPENSGLYDASCNGTWLLRKDVKTAMRWDNNNTNNFSTSSINTWLNDSYYNNSLGAHSAILQVKIPYGVGGGAAVVNSGANGALVHVFILGGYELGWTTSMSDSKRMVVDGAKLNYFLSGVTTSANNKRKANYQGREQGYFLRTCYNSDANLVYYTSGGEPYSFDADQITGVRPALILSPAAVFDSTTYVLKN